jgi:hypothetical protein
MSEEKKRRKRLGDRPDARAVKANGLQTVMCYLYPNRTENEVCAFDTVDITDLLAYIEKENAKHPEYKITIFHCFITAISRILMERPYLNRFIQRWRMYERDEISLSFIAKRRFADGAEEALIMLKPKEEDTLDSIARRIVGDIKETRKSEHSTGGIDKTLDQFAAIPWPILAPTIRFIRYMDFWGIVPKVFLEGNTNYSTVLLSNLGSIKGPAVYHHLNNYGSNSILVTIGTIHDEEVLMPDGTKQIRKMLEFSAILDERIADGFYFTKSLRLIRHIFANPELLERPLGEPSNFDYDAKA